MLFTYFIKLSNLFKEFRGKVLHNQHTRVLLFLYSILSLFLLVLFGYLRQVFSRMPRLTLYVLKSHYPKSLDQMCELPQLDIAPHLDLPLFFVKLSLLLNTVSRCHSHHSPWTNTKPMYTVCYLQLCTFLSWSS